MRKTITLKFRAVNKDIFDAIHDGRKKIETRAATTKYRDIKAGDTVVFSCGKEKFKKKVTHAEIFKTIAALLRKYKAPDINPFCATPEELEKMYYSFPGYKEKIKQSGLIALELE